MPNKKQETKKTDYKTFEEIMQIMLDKNDKAFTKALLKTLFAIEDDTLLEKICLVIEEEDLFGNLYFEAISILNKKNEASDKESLT